MSYLAFGVADISPHSFSLERAFHPPPKPPFFWFAQVTVQVQAMVHASYQGLISLVVFFQFSKILNFWVVSRVKRVKYGPKWQKSLICHASYLRNHTSYDLHLWYTSIKRWYLQELKRSKRATNSPKWQKLMLSSRSRKSYMIRF